MNRPWPFSFAHLFWPRLPRWALYIGISLATSPVNVFAGDTFYVATNGADVVTNGSPTKPWATITYALDHVPDGALIRVRPGIYNGRARIRGQFNQGVTVESEIPYQARLQHNGTVLTIWNDGNDVEGITISGFNLQHSGAGAAALVVQIQDGFNSETRRITLHNNIIHDSFNNDLLKINNGAEQIQIMGNMFYNQSGSDEHIDINSVDNVLVEGNIYFNDFSSSGRPNNNNTSSYIVVKDSNGSDDEYLGSQNITIRRNIFLNWEGSTGSNFVLCGEDGQNFHEAFDLLIENNLLVGNSANTMRSAFGAKGCRDIIFRANTITGDLPSLAFAMRLNREGANPRLENIQFFNNIWSDPTGTMEDFSDTPQADTLSFALDNNLYWNNGATLPQSGSDLLNPQDDLAAINNNPMLTAPSDVILPFWRQDLLRFNGDFASINHAFISLALEHGRIDFDSAARDQANSIQMPVDDLLGAIRDAQPDIGAIEWPAAETLFTDSFETIPPP